MQFLVFSIDWYKENLNGVIDKISFQLYCILKM